MASGWEYILARSRDMKVYGKFKTAHDRSLTADLNKSGQAGCWVPTADRLAALAIPWASCLIAQYDGEWFWSGPLNSRGTSMARGQVTIGAVGWFERLMNINLQEEQTYTNVDAGAIVADLLSKAIAQDPHFPITMGDVELSQLRTITYPRDQSIGQAIQDLVELESGLDWYIDPITRKLYIVARRGVDRPECKWTFIGDGKSAQSNLSDCFEDISGTPVNQISPRGKYSSGYGEDLVSQDSYGLFQTAPGLADVVDQNILNAYAAGEIFYRADPRTTYTLTPKPSSKASVPKLFRDFDIGDTGYLTARRDFISVSDQAVRMFGVSLAISDSGVETITNLQTTAG